MFLIGTDVHVSPLRGSWEVRRHGDARPTSIHQTRSSALRNARALAVDSRSKLIIHGIDGSATIEMMSGAPALEQAVS
ncbi:MAG: DUF2188 domain-containing protein [Actinobacteria bacterium]|nr:DUF2188 domain-containing protein [Actinomycetota bacterium]